MKREEDVLQRAIVTYLRTILSDRDYRVFAVPNGGSRDAREGANMKRAGVLAGVPDLLIIGSCGRAFFIEVKTPAGKLSLPQQDFRTWMVLASVPHVVARRLDDVRLALAQWGVKTLEAL